MHIITKGEQWCIGKVAGGKSLKVAGSNPGFGVLINYIYTYICT